MGEDISLTFFFRQRELEFTPKVAECEGSYVKSDVYVTDGENLFGCVCWIFVVMTDEGKLLLKLMHFQETFYHLEGSAVKV